MNNDLREAIAWLEAEAAADTSQDCPPENHARAVHGAEILRELGERDRVRNLFWNENCELKGKLDKAIALLVRCLPVSRSEATRLGRHAIESEQIDASQRMRQLAYDIEEVLGLRKP